MGHREEAFIHARKNDLPNVKIFVCALVYGIVYIELPAFIQYGLDGFSKFGADAIIIAVKFFSGNLAVFLCKLLNGNHD